MIKMMYRKLFMALVVLALPVLAAPLPPGFEAFYNLDYDAALREFQAAVSRNSSDPSAHNHVAQTVLYRQMCRAGALESELVSGVTRGGAADPSPERAKR